MFKLGTPVKDKVSGLPGILTHYMIDTSHNENYIFQPHGLNPKSGAPIETVWLDPKRIVGGKLEDEDVTMPLEILGTAATDKGSGYTGTVIALVRHINGCVHASVKARGKTDEGKTIDAVDFDLRRLEGPKIPKLTAKEKKVSEKAKPSPASYSSTRKY